MRISLLHLITGVSIVAWTLGLRNTAEDFRGIFVVSTFFTILLLKVLIAMTSSIDKDGNLKYKDNPLYQALEPTLNVTFGIGMLLALALGGLAIVIVAFCIVFLLS